MSRPPGAVLLDANVVIALSLSGHVHHEAASARREAGAWPRFATCPITQGALLRASVREGMSTRQAVGALEGICRIRGHEFWPDDLAYLGVELGQVVGHRQVTDAYLAALARAHRGRLATFDAGLAATHPDVAELVPSVG